MMLAHLQGLKMEKNETRESLDNCTSMYMNVCSRFPTNEEG